MNSDTKKHARLGFPCHSPRLAPKMSVSFAGSPRWASAMTVPIAGLLRRFLRGFRCSVAAVVGGVEYSIEKRHRQLRHRRVGAAHLLVISDFCDERDEVRSAVDGEPNHAQVGAAGQDSAEKLLGFRGSTGRRQAFGERALGLQQGTMSAPALQAVNPFPRPATGQIEPVTS